MALGLLNALVENDLLGSVDLKKGSADTMVGPAKVTTLLVENVLMGWRVREGKRWN